MPKPPEAAGLNGCRKAIASIPSVRPCHDVGWTQRAARNNSSELKNRANIAPAKALDGGVVDGILEAGVVYARHALLNVGQISGLVPRQRVLGGRSPDPRRL